MKKRISVASSVLKQAKIRRGAVPSAIVQLAEVGSALYSRVDNSPAPDTGASRLRVIIPGRKKPEIYDLSRLLVQPKLAALIAEGFRCWAAAVASNTRQANYHNIRINFADFLITIPDDLDPDIIDESFWTAFVRWLDAPKAKGQPWHQKTRAGVLGAVRSCFEALIGHARFGQTAIYLLDSSGFPSNPWPGTHTKIKPTPVLTPTEMDQLVLACLGEVAVISKRLRDREEILASGRERLDAARSTGQELPYDDISVCAALIAEIVPDRLASQNDLSAYDCELAAAVQYRHGMSAVRELLYNTYRELVPFVVLLAIRTAFNADTVLTLSWSNVTTSFDGRIITILGIKNRADRAQASPDNAEDPPSDDPTSILLAELGVPGGLADLLGLLQRLTERARTILTDRDHEDRLFIGIPIKSSKVVKGYGYITSGPSNDGAWRKSLVSFIQDHGLKPFSLKILRATEAENEYQWTGDLLAVKRRLNHKHTNTVRTHYTSDWMRQHGQDRIGEVQDLYVRWVETEGKVDPRGRSRYDYGATTPGFLCFDPYDSPRPGQRKDELCTAYGECPSCSLAAARPHDPQAASLYIALRKAIYDGQQGRISAMGWHEKWSGILADLDKLLALIPPEVKEQAVRYYIELKPVG